MQLMDLTKIEIPDDRALFDINMSTYANACIGVANDLGVFDVLESGPSTASDIAEKLNLSTGAISAICQVLVAFKMLKMSDAAAFALEDVSRLYLCSGSPVYRGASSPILKDSFDYRKVATAAKEGWSPIGGGGKSFTEMWTEGNLSSEAAKRFTSMMQAIIFGPALASARGGAFARSKHVIDAGGGSGAFCMAIAAHQPWTKVTLMDLPQVCDAAVEHLQRFGFKDRIRMVHCNFFKDEWPSDGDAFLFSNILHDWPFSTGRQLLSHAFQALPSGGHLYLHEALLDESKTSPQSTVVFNLLMYLNHRSQQYTWDELSALIRGVGFIEPEVVHGFSYYSTIRARKP